MPFKRLTLILVFAALATFTAAASLPGSLPVTSVSYVSEHSVPAFSEINDTPAVGGTPGSLENKVEIAVDIRDLKPVINNAVRSTESKINARSTITPSIAAIFSDLKNQLQHDTEELTFVTPSNISASLVEMSVSSIHASLTTAISRLQAFKGQNPGVGLKDQLTDRQVASLASDNINILLGAISNVANAAASAGIDVDGIVPDLGVGGGGSGLLSTVGVLLQPILSLLDSLLGV